MDVRCTRCGTEYEFDDALISERGTSVRCTQCGHQFKVFPPQLAGIGPDEWIVLTSLGRRIVYRSLRELQNGIAKAEVAREDLLARGTKPPRPLGSIAELDSLFVIKAAPERQPSTLTGVAPPAAGQTKGAPARQAHDTFAGVAPPPGETLSHQDNRAIPPPGGSLGRDGRDTFSGVEPQSTVGGSAATGDAKAIPPPGGSLGKEGHDTFSGVAPPPGSPEAPENPYANRHGAPLRVGGTRTVLGIGSLAPDAIDFEPRRPPAVAGVGVSSPPETQSFEARPRAPMPSIDEEGTVLQAPPLPPMEPATAELATAELATDQHTDVQAPVAVETEPLQLNVRDPKRRDVEDPVVNAHAVGDEVTRGAGARDSASLSVAEPATRTFNAEAEPAKSSVVTEPERPPAAIGRVQLEKKLVKPMASDPPTEKWIAQESSLTAQDAPTLTSPEPVVRATSDNNSLPPTTRSGAQTEPVEPLIDVQAMVAAKFVATPAMETLVADRASKEPHTAHDAPKAHSATNAPKAHSATNAPKAHSATNAPKARSAASAAKGVHVAPSAPEAQGKSTALRTVITLGLLGLGLYVGMKIVGSQLQSGATSERLTASTTPPDIATAVPSPVTPAASDVAADITRRLAVGDVTGAEQLLTSASEAAKIKPSYRMLQLRALVMSADLAWWKVQLIGKRAGADYTQAKQSVTEKVERYKREVGALGPDSEWPEPILAAFVDVRKMQNEKGDLADPKWAAQLTHPTTLELKYSLLVSAWVRAGVPDDSTIAGLRQVRAVPADWGPHAVALLVALVQMNRLDDAKTELKTLADQSPPHPLLKDMQAYVTNAEQANAAPSSSAAAGTALGNDSVELDADILEGDFRVRLTRANQCLARNELTRAQKLLRSVLAQRPNDTEAITAMGDLQKRRGDMTQARASYEKAISLNGNYLPALSGAADVKWRSGDRAGAALLYRRIMERVGDSPGYGQNAAARLKELEGNPSSAERDAKPASKDTQ